jgi:hypothetical protein
MASDSLPCPAIEGNPHTDFLRKRNLLLRDIVSRDKPRDDAERAEHERITAEIDRIQGEITKLEAAQ